MAVDFNTKFLEVLERLQSKIEEHEKAGIRADIAALNTSGLSPDEIWYSFVQIYDGFHGDMERYSTLDQKTKRAELVREFYRLLAAKLLAGKPLEYRKIPLEILMLKKYEKSQAQAQAAKLEEDMAIHQLMTNALVEEVVKGGRRKKTNGKRKTQRRRRSSTRRR
jgi:hypothetical protein